MPIVEYQCDEGHEKVERIELSRERGSLPSMNCATCSKPLHVIISTPAAFRFPDMAVLNKRRQRIKEPIWRYPDGSFEPVNP